MEDVTTLEVELAGIALAHASERDALLGLRHWGWDGRGGATLAAAGREAGGISRERARQICAGLAKRLADARPVTPFLDEALALAGGMAPTSASALAARLADAHLSSRAFHPAGLLNAARVLGRDAPFTLETIRGHEVMLPEPPDPGLDARELVTTVLDVARGLVRRGGAARIPDVTGRVAADLGTFLDDASVRALLGSLDDFAWLDRRAAWFTLTDVARNAVASRVLKVLSVSRRMSLADLHAGIRRDERMREFVMPEYVLGEFCERLPGVDVGDGIVRAAAPLPPEDVLESTELTLVRILRRHGGTLERRELERLGREAGLSIASLHGRLAYSPIVTELGGRRVGLRGLTSVDESGGESPPSVRRDDPPRPGDLEHFTPARRR